MASRIPSPQLLDASINFSGTGDQTVIAAVSGKSIRICGLFLSKSAGAETLTFKDGASTSLTGAMTLAAGIPLILSLQDVNPWFNLTKGNAFIIAKSAGVEQVSGRVYYQLMDS